MIILNTNVVSELMRQPITRRAGLAPRASRPRPLHSGGHGSRDKLRHRTPPPKDGAGTNCTTQPAKSSPLSDQVLSSDLTAASAYAGTDSVGSPINGFDAQIAAICRTMWQPSPL